MIVVGNAFTISAPVDQVFEALLDARRVAGCLPGGRSLVTEPGAAATEADAHLRLIFGRRTVTYQGTLEITGHDRDAGAVTYRGAGRETRGDGSISAIIDVRIRASGRSTLVSVQGEAQLTGRGAGLSRATGEAVAHTALRRFASLFAALMGESDSPPEGADTGGDIAEITELVAQMHATPAAGPHRRTRSDEPRAEVRETLAVGDAAGHDHVVSRRFVPWLPAAILSGVAVLWLWRRRSH